MAETDINVQSWVDKQFPQLLAKIPNLTLLTLDPTDKIVKEIKADILSGGTETVPQWQSDVIYNEGDIIAYSGEFWESQQDNNEGNPPVEGGSFWDKLPESTSNGFGRYAAGVYTIDPTLVVNGDSLYILSQSVTLPFNSTDFAAELANGDWIGIGSDTFNKVDFNPQSTPQPYQVGRIFYDNTENTWTAYNDLEGVALQLGEELRGRLINDTGGTLLNGALISVIGRVGSSLKVELTDVTSLNSSSRAFGLITLEANDGSPTYAVTVGAVRGLDTSAYTSGDLLYGDPNNPGGYTNVAPKAPFYPVRVGAVLTSDATQGVIVTGILSFNSNDTALNSEGVLNGIVLDTPNINFSVTAGVIYADLTNEKYPTRNLPFILSGTRFDLDTLTNSGSGGAARVEIPQGTSSVLQTSQMYIYIDNDVPTFAVSTSEPNVPYASIGTVATYDAARTLAEGEEPYSYRRKNNTQDRIDGVHDGAYGLFTEVLYWLRSLGSAWISGQDATPLVDNTQIRVQLSAGMGRQFRRNSLLPFDGLEYRIMNDELNVVGNYPIADNLISITTTAGGATDDLLANNRYYTIRLYFQLNSDGIENRVIATRPSGYYTSSTAAIQDALGYATPFSDTDIEDIVWPLYDLVIGRTGGSGATISLEEIKDKRTKIPFGSAGGSGSSGGVGTDDKIRITANDTTNDYLDPKLTVGDEFEKEIINPLGNESLLIKFKGWIYNTLRTFKLINSADNLTADRTITWQDKSIIPAGLDDVADIINSQIDLSSQVGTGIASGNVRFNQTNQSTVTALYFSKDEYNSGKTEKWLLALNENAVLGFKAKGNRAKYSNYIVSSVTDDTGFITVNLSSLDKGADFLANDVVSVFMLNIGSEKPILVDPPSTALAFDKEKKYMNTIFQSSAFAFSVIDISYGYGSTYFVKVTTNGELINLPTEEFIIIRNDYSGLEVATYDFMFWLVTDDKVRVSIVKTSDDMPPFNYLTFDAGNLFNITDNGDETYTGSSSTPPYNNYALANESITGAGSVRCDIPIVSTDKTMIGFRDDFVNERFGEGSGYDFYVLQAAGNYYYGINGGGAVNTGIASQDGDFMRIRRISGSPDTVVGEYFRGGIWTIFHDFGLGNPIVGTTYFQISTSDSGNVIFNPILE